MRQRVFQMEKNGTVPRWRGHARWVRLWLAVVLAWAVFSAEAASALDAEPAIKGITLLSAPVAVQVTLDKHAPFRAVRVDARDVMIAFKGVRLAEKVSKKGNAGALIRQVKIDRLPDNVISIGISTDRDVGDVQADWNPKTLTLTTRLKFSEPDPSVPCLVLKDEFKKPADLHQKLVADGLAGSGAAHGKAAAPPSAEPKSAPPAAPVAAPAGSLAAAPAAAPEKIKKRPASVPPVPSTTGLSGGTDDLLLIMAQGGGGGCPKVPQVEEALSDCRIKDWQGALDLLRGPDSDTAQGTCQEKRLYLKAYACFRSNRLGQDSVYLDALNYFQDALSYFPKSPYAPYAMASIGKIYCAMKNYAEAKGYFKLLLDTYKSYPGRPEVLFELGNIHAENHELKQAIATYRQFLATYPHSQFAPDVELGLGKALYDANQYADALALMKQVLAQEPKMAFKHARLLIVMGNCYYQLGKSKKARATLARGYNLFPDAADESTTLTRIGDTYRDTGELDKARKIYQIVMDKYPGTDGYIISAMRRAALLPDGTEKESAYQKIIDAFPDHPVAKLAVAKLADMQYRAGQYQQSIETLRPLLGGNSGNLASDASYIMQSAFEGLVKKLLKAGSYPEIIALKHKEWRILQNFDRPDLFQNLGIAYLKGHLYSEAVSLLERARALSNGQEPAALHYELGVALQESGKPEAALEQFGVYIEKAPRGTHVTDAYCRMGRMFMGQGDFKNAMTVLQSVRQLDSQASDKIRILRLTAEADCGLEHFDRAAKSLLEVRGLLEKAPGKDLAAITDTNRQLGETYMRLKAYGKAIKAFLAALSTNRQSPSPRLLMQLGEAYQKAGDPVQAKKTYTRVLTLGDDFWQYLAQERLRGMAVADRLRSEGV